VVISGFDWNDDNVEHIRQHNFDTEEVEEVFAGAYKIRRNSSKPLYRIG